MGNPCKAVALSCGAATAAAKGDANETLDVDRLCRLCICGNAGIFCVSHADCSGAFGNRRNRQLCHSRQGWPRPRSRLGQSICPTSRMEPRAKSRLAWSGLPPWSLEARALLSRLDSGNGPARPLGRFPVIPSVYAAENNSSFGSLICKLDLKSAACVSRKRKGKARRKAGLLSL